MSCLDNLEHPVSDNPGQHSSPQTDMETIQWAFDDTTPYKTDKNVVASKNFSCQYCGMIIQDKYGLSMHIRRKHELNLPFGCTHCPKAFVIHSELKKHLLIHSDLKIYECDVCSKSFRSRTGRNQHRATHYNTLKFKCDFCIKSFMRPQDLKMHIKFVHSTNSGGYKCSFCYKKFVSIDCLESHQKCHVKSDDIIMLGVEGTPHFNTNKRPKKKCRKLNLCDSENYKKIDSGECFICHEKFIFRRAALAHLVAHHPEDASVHFSFRCSECDYIGRSKVALREHSFLHSSEKTFKCPHCDYAAVRKIDITRHIDIHSAEKNYACNICGKKFISKFRLTNHKKIHGKKIIACDICDKKYRSKSYMIAHRRSVHFSTRKLCDTCGKSYSSIQALVRHQKKDHSKELSQAASKSDLPTIYDDLVRPKRNATQYSEMGYNEESLLCFECFACGKQFSSAIEMNLHIDEYQVLKKTNGYFEEDIQSLHNDSSLKISTKESSFPIILGDTSLEMSENYLNNSYLSSHINLKEHSDDSGFHILKDGVIPEREGIRFSHVSRIGGLKHNYRKNGSSFNKEVLTIDHRMTSGVSTKSKLVSIGGKDYLPINEIESSDLSYLAKLLIAKDKKES